MFKEVAVCFAFLSVAGCDVNLSALRPVKWATVDVNKVRAAIKDIVVSENPYPAELEAVRGGEDEYMRIRNQVANLKSAASENCRKLHMTSGMAPKAPSVALSSTSEEGYYIQQYQSQRDATSDYRECVRAITDDQLISDLSLKMATHDKLRQARNVHEREVAQKTEDRAREIVAIYGKSNGYDLVVEERGAGVIYNASNMVVDVTGGVLDSMQR